MCEAVMIMFSCVMAIHMGLVDAVLEVLRLQNRSIPVIQCPKCLTFHAVLWFLVFTDHNIIVSLATAFLAAYIAIWLDLFLGLMDYCYEHIYKRIPEEGGIYHSESNRKSEDKDNSLP